MNFCTLCLAQGSIILCRSIQSGNVDHFLEVVANITIKHKQLDLLKGKRRIKAHCIKSALSKVKYS